MRTPTTRRSCTQPSPKEEFEEGVTSGETTFHVGKPLANFMLANQKKNFNVGRPN